MNLICGVFGHRWDKSQKEFQFCKRWSCEAYRVLYKKTYPKTGESLHDWEVIDI